MSLRTTQRPSVSVVIATYNKADTIAAAIQSVLQQSYRDHEILVVDDGSTDNTASVVGRFGDKVRYLPKVNGGTGSARNLGIQEARGEYVAFLDGDDLWMPDKLKLQMAAFAREPDLVGAQCSAYCVDNTLRVLEARRCTPRQDTLLDFLLFHNLPAFASCLVAKRQVLQALGGFGTDLVILSDWDMACRLARTGTLRSVPELLVLYRHYPSNQSRDVGIHIWSGMRSMKRFFAHPKLDSSIRAREQQIRARFYAMLSGGFVRNRQWFKGLAWAQKAVATSPKALPYCMGMPLRRLVKWIAPRPQASFAQTFPFAVNGGDGILKSHE